jgi:hypothetical protein
MFVIFACDRCAIAPVCDFWANSCILNRHFPRRPVAASLLGFVGRFVVSAPLLGTADVCWAGFAASLVLVIDIYI